MKNVKSNIRMSDVIKAANSKLQYAATSSNNGMLELTNAVRQITYQFYEEYMIENERGEYKGYAFIKRKLDEYGFTGYEFSTPLPDRDYERISS